MATKGYKDNEQQAFTPTPTDWLGIQQGSLLSDMKKITYKDLTDPLQEQIDDHEQRVDDLELAEDSIKGVGWTGASLQSLDENKADKATTYTKTEVDVTIDALDTRLDTLEGTGAGSVKKAIDDAVSPLEEDLDYLCDTYKINKTLDFVSGKINGSGEFVADVSGWWSTDYIDTSTIEKIINSSSDSSYVVYIHLYDESKNFINYYTLSSDSDFEIPKFGYVRIGMASATHTMDVSETTIINGVFCFSPPNNVVNELQRSLDGVFGLVDLFSHKNLFDSSNVIKGFYINSIKPIKDNSWCYYEIDCKESEEFIFEGTRGLIAWFNESTLISTQNAYTKVRLIAPANCTHFYVSSPISSYTDVSIIKTPYIRTIGKGMMFEKPSDALYGMTEGDEAILLIYPGIYEDVVDIRHLKVALIGIDRDTCIIQNGLGDYNYPPVNASGDNNIIANLTLYSYATETVANSGSYGLHIDRRGIGTEGGDSYIRNCNIKSITNAGVGLGLTNKQHIYFDNCYIESERLYAFYSHNYQLSGAIEQKLDLKNCEIHTKASFRTFVFSDVNNFSTNGTKDDARDTILTLINNVMYSDTLGMKNMINMDNAQDGCINGYIKLSNHCFGNSDPNGNTSN